MRSGEQVTDYLQSKTSGISVTSTGSVIAECQNVSKLEFILGGYEGGIAVFISVLIWVYAKDYLRRRKNR